MKIEFKSYPGFVMQVLEEKSCDGDDNAEEHPAYKVVDPEGTEDWVCSRDVQVVQA